MSLFCLPWLVADGRHALANPLPNVPPGFEEIALGQVEHLDIRLLGQSLGLFPVFVRPDDVRLETPEAVARAIDERFRRDASEPSAALLVQTLARPMARNGHLACDGASTATGCRYLDTESADVVFDETQGVLELFLAKAWLPSHNAVGPAYHMNSAGSESALIHTQVLNASTTDRYRNLTIMGNGALGISPGSYAGMTWSLVHASYGGRHDAASSGGTRATLDGLYYRHDLGAAHYVQAGRMDQRNLSSAQGGSFGFTLLPVERFDGARIGTSQAYLNDAAAAQGSPLTVLLTRDARVDAYRGNELLGSAYFAAGVQQFDTRYFPEGSYLVSLRIFEGDTLVRTEREPYTKVGGGAFGGGTQWFFQTGRTVSGRHLDTSSTRQSLTVQSGVRTTLGLGLTLTTGLVWLPSRVYNETQFGWQHTFPLGQLTTTAALLTGSDGAHGNTQSLSFSNGVGVSLYRYQMRDAGCRDGSRATAGRAVNLGCYDSLNASVSVPLGQWQGSAGYSESRTYRRRSAYADADAFVPLDDGFRRDGAARAGVSKTLQATLSRSFRWNKLTIGTRMGGYRRHHAEMGRPDTGAFVNLSLSAHRPAAPGRSLSTFSSAGADVRTSTHDDRGVRTDYHASHAWTWDDTSRREILLGFIGSDEGAAGTVNVRGAVEGLYGDVHAALSRTLRRPRQGEASGSFTGGYASSVAVSRDGVWLGPAMLAGEPPAGVALGVDAGDDSADDAARGAAATLQVGGRPLTLDFGASAFVPISGYRAQQGEVSEARQGVTDYSIGLLRGAGLHDYFLTPGRLKVHRVIAGRSYTYVGRALGPDGLSLDHARVLSVAAPPLDERGEFMIESPHPVTELFLLDRGQPMRCELRTQARRDVIHLTGLTQCEVVARHALPESLQTQLRVRRLLGETTPPVDRHDRQASVASPGAVRLAADDLRVAH